MRAEKDGAEREPLDNCKPAVVGSSGERLIIKIKLVCRPKASLSTDPPESPADPATIQAA